MSGFAPKARNKMDTCIEARDLVAEIGRSHAKAFSVKEVLHVAARLTGISPRRVRAFWHGEARSVRADELDALRIAAQRTAQTEQAAADELTEIRRRLVRLEYLLVSSSPDPTGPCFHPDRINDGGGG